MQCEKFESRLNQLLDERRQPELDDQLLAHTSGCDECRQMLAAQQLLFGAMSGTPSSDELSLEPPLDMADRVLRETGPLRPAGRLRVVRWFAFVAAAVLLVASLPRAMQFISGNNPVVESPGIGSSDDIADDGPAVTPKDISPLSTPGESQDDLDVSDEVRYQQFVSTWGTSLGNGVARYSDADAINESIGQFASLRPLRNSMSAALDALRKTLPRITTSRDGHPS